MKRNDPDMSDLAYGLESVAYEVADIVSKAVADPKVDAQRRLLDAIRDNDTPRTVLWALVVERLDHLNNL